MSGWIKLYRSLQDSPFYSNSVAVHCWIECLLRASHVKTSFYIKREKIDLEPGQFIMGRDEFGKKIGVSGSTAWYWILQFKADSKVDIKQTSKGSLVSIKNWGEFQKADSEVDSGRTADEQQLNTNKNIKNVKNNTIVYSEPSLTENDFQEIAEAYGVPTEFVGSSYDSMMNWCEAKGKKYKNYKAALRNWVKSDAIRRLDYAKSNSKKRALDFSNL